MPSTTSAMSRTWPSLNVRTTPTLSLYLTVLIVCRSTGCAGSVKSMACRPACPPATKASRPMVSTSSFWLGSGTRPTTLYGAPGVS
ncbi:MAG: hypothetical protein IPG61_17825 [bacterium]|nr:hypothetical protein [bacterium]